MKKTIFALLLLTTGCQDQLGNTPQEGMNKARTACRDGVEYLQFNGRYDDTFTAHLKSDGKPYTC